MGSGAQTIFLGVEPAPASRPRVTRWGVYYGKNYEKFRTLAKDFLRSFKQTPRSGALNVVLEFLISPPKTTKRDYPRGDVDNFAKGVLDSLTTNGGFWEDDDQITTMTVIKRFARPDEQAGVYITLNEDKTYESI
jgi:Holliday junction resolvase RusA-like endonuclease